MPRKRRKLLEQDISVSARYDTKMPEPRSGESYEQYYKRMSHAMNYRLRSLEKLAQSGDTHFKGVLKYAYANAQYDITAITGSEVRRRFPESLPKTSTGAVDQRELHRRLNAIKRFYESPTSTKSGIIAVYQQKADTINDKLHSDDYGYEGNTKFTWEDLANFYESGLADKFTGYGSQTVLVALAIIKENMINPDKIKEAKKGNLKLSDDEVEAKIIQDLLQSGLK